MSETQKSIARGVTVLGLAGIICKVVGALYRVPLSWIMGDYGLGVYQMVFPTYNLLLTISSAGIPVAISRMVSFSLAQNDPRSAKRIFRIATVLLAALGSIAAVMMFGFSGGLASWVGEPNAKLGFMAIAPALLLVCVMSALRGFMQGQQNMVPTAISQLIEQVGKVVIILPMAWWGMRISPAYAAAMVLLGNTIAEVVALLYMWVIHRKNRKNFAAIVQDEGRELPGTKVLVRRLLALSIPITLGGSVIPLAGFMDSGMIVNRLMDAGFHKEMGVAMYGRYSAYVLSLINVPTALSIAIAMSLVPAISSAMARGDAAAVKRQSNTGLRFSFLMGLPCSVGLCMLSRQILAMVYRFDTPEALQVTAGLLNLSSLTIVIFTVTQATTGILQGLQKQRIPMYTLLAGVAVKIILNYTLVGIPSIHIYGAPIASIACYTISMVPNLYFVLKYTRMKMEWKDTLIKPALATAGMAALLFLAIRLLPEGRLWTCLLVVIGIAAYLGLALLVGAMHREDFAIFLRRFGRGKQRV